MLAYIQAPSARRGWEGRSSRFGGRRESRERDDTSAVRNSCRDLRRGLLHRGLQNTRFRSKQHGKQHCCSTDTTCNIMFLKPPPSKPHPCASPNLGWEVGCEMLRCGKGTSRSMAPQRVPPPCAVSAYDTHVCERNTPPEKTACEKTSLQSTKSGAGEQFLLLLCMARARLKGVLFVHRHRYGSLRAPVHSVVRFQTAASPVFNHLLPTDVARILFPTPESHEGIRGTAGSCSFSGPSL